KIKQINHSVKNLTESANKLRITVSSHSELLKEKRREYSVLKETLSEKIAESHRDINKISQEYKKVHDDEIRGSSLLAKAEVEYSHTKKSIPDSDQCPSCNQVITKEYRKECEDRLHKELEKKQNDIDFYKKALAKCRAVKNRLSTELDNAKKHAADVSELKNKEKSLLENIKVYE